MKYFLPTFITLILSILLTTVANANHQQQQADKTPVVLECSLPPFTFTVYKPEWKPERNVNVSTIYIHKLNEQNPAYTRQAKVKMDGSGVCRHSVWTFYMGVHMNLPITVREIRCWGEEGPPENAKAYVDTVPWTRNKHFCY